MQWQASFKRTWCLVTFELVRLFFTKRGAFSIVTFATLWLLILYYAISPAVTLVSSPSFQDLATQFAGDLGLSKLLKWPVIELAVYWMISAYLLPMFALMISSDQTCSDRTRGTLRFISLRATRTEIMIGRFLGQWLIMAIVIALTLFATLFVAALRDIHLPLLGLLKAGVIFVNLLLIVAPFIALMTFFNSFIRSARLAVIASMLFFGLLPSMILFIEYIFGLHSHLTNIFPGAQVSDILGQQHISLFHYALPIVQTIGYLMLADLLMKRSSL